MKDVVFRYPNSTFEFSFKNVNIEPGSATAIIGPSGCGKTTFLSLISGILTQESGEISVQGQQLEKISEGERREFRIKNIGNVFQDFALIDYLTIYDNILHPFRINSELNLDTGIKQRVSQMADEFGITHCMSSYQHEVSHGEQQRAAICRALINEPKIILADEPTGNLDPKNKQWVLKVLHQYKEKNNAAIIVATHDHDLLKQFDYVIDLKEHHHGASSK